MESINKDQIINELNAIILDREMWEREEVRQLKQQLAELQESHNKIDLVQLKKYYGSWDEVRKIIDSIEENENDSAYEKHTSGGC